MPSKNATTFNAGEQHQIDRRHVLALTYVLLTNYLVWSGTWQIFARIQDKKKKKLTTIQTVFERCLLPGDIGLLTRFWRCTDLCEIELRMPMGGLGLYLMSFVPCHVNSKYLHQKHWSNRSGWITLRKGLSSKGIPALWKHQSTMFAYYTWEFLLMHQPHIIHRWAESRIRFTIISLPPITPAMSCSNGGGLMEGDLKCKVKCPWWKTLYRSKEMDAILKLLIRLFISNVK